MKHIHYKSLFLVLQIIVSNNLFGTIPRKEYIETPASYSLSFFENNFLTSDSLIIASWHIPPQGNVDKKVSVIVSYGDFGNMSYWLKHATSLSLAGYDVWLYDYRGFGRSSYFNIDPDMLYYNEFALDLDAVIKGVLAQTDNKICLMGFSMGSIVSMLRLSEERNDIDFYIGDGHICFPEMTLDRFKKGLKVPIKSISFPNFYKTNHIPFLMFQGTEDPVCTNTDIDSLKKYKKELLVIPYEGKHLHSYQVLGDKYISEINDLLSGKE